MPNSVAVAAVVAVKMNGTHKVNIEVYKTSCFGVMRIFQHQLQQLQRNAKMGLQHILGNL